MTISLGGTADYVDVGVKMKIKLTHFDQCEACHFIIMNGKLCVDVLLYLIE